MEFRDYLRAFGRSWYLIVIAVVVGGALAWTYATVAPKRWEAVTALVLVADGTQSVAEAQQGAALVESSASTAATIIDSPAVLSDAAAEAGVSVDDLGPSTTATARLGTATIDVIVASSDADLAARSARAIAASAIRNVPSLVGGITPDGQPQVRVEVIREATTPSRPTSPDLTGVLGIGLTLGLLAGIAISILRFSLDPRIRGARDLERLGVPVVSTPARAGKGEGDALRSASRTTLAVVRGTRAHAKTILVANVGDPAKASPLAKGLAEASAAAREDTVLVDVDFSRQPVLRWFEGIAGPSVSELLAGAPLGEDSSATRVERLWALRAGEAPEGDLLSSAAFPALLSRLAAEFDKVVVHAPAVTDGTDAVAIARTVDVVVLVARAGKDTVAACEAAVGTLADIGARPAAIVLERAGR